MLFRLSGSLPHSPNKADSRPLLTMKPAPFLYFAPQEIDEALELLEQHGDEAKILAGGQSLMPLLSLRLTRPGVIVDINRLANLAFIRKPVDGGLTLGALTRQRALERSPDVASQSPLLSATMPFIAHFQIRNRWHPRGEPRPRRPCRRASSGRPNPRGGTGPAQRSCRACRSSSRLLSWLHDYRHGTKRALDRDPHSGAATQGWLGNRGGRPPPRRLRDGVCRQPCGVYADTQV